MRIVGRIVVVAALLAAGVAHSAPQSLDSASRVQLWESLTMRFSPAYGAVTVRFDRTSDRLAGNVLSGIVLSSGDESYAIRDSMLRDIRLNDLGDAWIAAVTVSKNTRVITLYIPFVASGRLMLAQIDVTAMRSHRIAFRQLG